MEDVSKPLVEKPIHAPAGSTIDVVAAPKPELDVKEPPKDDTEPEKSAPKEVVKDKPKKPETPKQPGSGVGLAVFATVVIVLGLAAMATYAYMQTQK